MRIHSKTLTSLALLSAFAAGASAQENPIPQTEFTLDIQSGIAANDGVDPTTVIAFHVSIEGAPWLRLYFSDVVLSGDVSNGTGSVLKITSLEDGYFQILNSKTLAEWNNSSAYFNGDLLLIEVIAQPGTGQNQLTVTSADVGLIPPPANSRTICGSDDRIFSTEPRSSRLLPIGCTGFIVDDGCGCFGTAGHCISGSNTVQFNVPISNPNGSINHPPPSDQYSTDNSSRQSTNGGIGNDWAYFGAFPNSNTGLTAIQAQGGSYDLRLPPPFNGSNTIRITGFGTDSGTSNQAQQTNNGPWWSHTGTTLRYRVDTTGGSSGSPVLHEQTGNVIGVHTNGGCGSSSTSSNSGTAYNNPNWQNAVANPRGVCVKLTCGIAATAVVRNGSNTNPICFNSLSAPAIGTTWMAEIDTSSVPGATLTIVQIRQAPSSGVPTAIGELLIDLTSPLIVNSEVFTSGGAAIHTFPIPPSLTLAGHTVYAQGGIQAGGAFVTLCNALDVNIGCTP